MRPPSKFTLSVHLQDVLSPDQSEALSRVMASHGFLPFITSDNGARYVLPPGQYDFQGDFTKSEVLTKARAALDTACVRYGLMVTESRGRVWHGLQASPLS